jgi:biopolymer transport protein ExbD
MAGGGEDSSGDAITAINVTPLVDIVLVLLIIFMVTAKLIVSKSVPLDLPKAASGSDIQTVFSIVLAADGTTQIDSKTVPNDDVILAQAKAAHDKNPELRAIIKADSAVTHGRVIHVLDLLKQAQVAKIAFGVSPVMPGVPATPGGAGAPAPVPAPPK